MREFEDTVATVENIPLLIGLFGASSSGKTYSALRLATGIQRVAGGDIFIVDTESKRGKHYAKIFNYRHVDFKPPFGPLDYLAVVEHCVRRGARTVIIDSMSHEHEGPGGVLEQHAAEVERMIRERKMSHEKAQFPAWAKPKAARRQFIQALTQMDVNLILCFRAKDKINMVGGRPAKGGYVPIGDDDYIFECTVRALLLPNSKGVPDWNPKEEGSRAVVNLPDIFRDVFAGKGPLNEEMGAKMAEWAAGKQVELKAEKPAEKPANDQEQRLMLAIAAAHTPEVLESLIPQLKECPTEPLREAFKARKAALQGESG